MFSWIQNRRNGQRKLNQQQRRQNSRRELKRKMLLQKLDPRQMMAGDLFQIDQGVLKIEGTDNSDTAQIGYFGDGNQIEVTINQQTSLVDASEVTSIEFIGGAGNDTFRNHTDLSMTAFGGAGNDQIYGGTAADILRGGTGRDRVFGGAGNDQLQGGGGRDNLYGNDGDDVLRGGDDFDTIYAGAGNDTADGGAGNDRILGQDGNDLLFGGTGNDRIAGNNGDDALNGGEGNDRLHGGNNNDALYGDDGKDYLHGGRHDDLLQGGQGADKLDGKAGYDRAIADDQDTVSRSTESVDRSQASATTNSFPITSEGQLVIEGTDGPDVVRVQQSGDYLTVNSSLDATADQDQPVTTEYPSAWTSSILFHGKDGNDAFINESTISLIAKGGPGNDTLIGGQNSDRLEGGEGADLVFGMAGNDVLRGGNDGASWGVPVGATPIMPVVPVGAVPVGATLILCQIQLDLGGRFTRVPSSVRSTLA